MEREIKFRAWHSGEPAKGKFNGIPAVMLYDERPGDCLTFKNQGQPVEVMQYTGFKDKMDNCIYEGDIVMVKGTKRTGAYKTKVIYRAPGFTLADNKTYLNEYVCLRAVTEVIGNIHETPELLTETE